MAVRLRWIEPKSRGMFGYWIALCAAEYPGESGDVYLDDDQDRALRVKYIEDYKSEGLIKED